MGGQSFKCPYCEKWTLDKRALKDHLRDAHALRKVKIEDVGPATKVIILPNAVDNETLRKLSQRPRDVVPSWRFWNPHSGLLGGLIVSAILFGVVSFVAWVI